MKKFAAGLAFAIFSIKLTTDFADLPMARI